jgi:hypothetical protein
MRVNDTEQDARSIQSEWRDAELVKQLDSNLAPTFERIEANWHQVEARAEDEVSSSEELRSARQIAQSAKEIYSAYDAAAARINADRGLNDAGRRERLAPEREKRDAMVEQARGRINALAASLATRYADKSFPSPSPDLAAEASLVMQRFSLMDAGGFASEVADVVRRANDPNTPIAEQYRLNHLLQIAYKPLVDRRARAPENFARKLAPLAEKLSGSIEKHLDVVLNRPASRAAKELAQRIPREFGSVEAWVTNPGSWGLLAGGRAEGVDWSLVEQAHPLLFPKEG